jgi:3D (Asp-Asp-Asp) domain-containing protein
MRQPRGAARHLAALVISVTAFVLLYQVTTFDSRHAAQQADEGALRAIPVPGARLRFTATAYCQGSVTASGVAPQTGVAAADPALLPVGSVVQVSSAPPYGGVYTIMDTGPMIQGRRLDIYIWSCTEALQFGRRPIEVTVLRLGWDPRASTPSLIDGTGGRPRQGATEPLPSRPMPLSPPAFLR